MEIIIGSEAMTFLSSSTCIFTVSHFPLSPSALRLLVRFPSWNVPCAGLAVDVFYINLSSKNRQKINVPLTPMSSFFLSLALQWFGEETWNLAGKARRSERCFLLALPSMYEWTRIKKKKTLFAWQNTLHTSAGIVIVLSGAGAGC